MAKWKPTFYVTNGKPGAIAPLRKFARKLLEQSKTYNEEYGSYANPVRRFSYKETKFVVSSLPGYDIIEITTPSPEDEEEVGGAADVYSGFWEPTYQSHSIGLYLRWYPSGYEVYNSDPLGPPVAAGFGASVDGAAEELETAPMPPNRWMENNYDPEIKEEAPWFVNTAKTVSATSIHPGKYSGLMRKLVQMQLGYGLLPQFAYTASNSNGIYLETLDEDTTRVWLYQISATNGVVMQIMMDYSEKNFEKAAKLKSGETPPEITEMGWFALQTSFDITRPLYTKAEWDALPAAEQPPITAVTFELLSSAAYLSVVSEYGAYGDYGWSFNPAGTSAVFCGIAWNDDVSPARNYRSNILTVTLNPTAFTAGVAGAGDNPFLTDSAFDHVKFPNSNGTLETVYFWKGENGFKGTQPSTNYTAPIYTYYNLNGELVTCSYQWVAGVAQTKNGGSAFVLGWAEMVACREITTWGVEFGTGNYHYKACSSGQSGTGTYGYKHGFTTQITTPDRYDIFSGYEAEWSSAHAWGYRDQSVWYGSSDRLKVVYTPTSAGPAALGMDEHWYERTGGDFSGSSKSVLIIPSFERLAYYHYKEHNKVINNGAVHYPHHWSYERGTPARQQGTGALLYDDCEYAPCGAPQGVQGDQRPEVESAAEYYMASNPRQYSYPEQRGYKKLRELQKACGINDSGDCFPPPEDVDGTRPNDIPSGYSSDVTTLTGGLVLPNGGSIVFSEDEIENQSSPFRESSSSYGYQSVVSCFDTFSGKYIFSMPEIAMTARKHTATGFPDDIAKTGVLFSGMPYFL